MSSRQLEFYSHQVECFFQDKARAHTLLNPLEARNQTDGLRIHKADKSDAHKLAQSHYRFKREKKFIEARIYRELREASRFYGETVENIKKQLMYLHGPLQQTFPELEVFFASRISTLAVKLIEFFPHPDLMKELSWTKLKNMIQKQTDKKLSDRKALDKAE